MPSCAYIDNPNATNSAGEEGSGWTTDTNSTTQGDGDGDGGPGEGDGDPGDGDPGDGDGDPGDGDGDGDGDPIPAEILVSGEVTDFSTMMGIVGANVSVKGIPEFETVSSPGGSYEILGMPPNTEVFFLLDGNESQYWGGIRPALLPATDIDDLQLGQISNELIEQQLGLLQMQDPNVMADETRGIIIVRLLQQVAATEGIGATVTMQPPPSPGTSYAADGTMGNAPILDNNTINSSGLPFWVAFNVDPDEIGGAVTIMVEHETRECTVLHPVFPIRARYVTLVYVDCPPSP